MRVCYFGTYRDEYSRNRIMIEGLRRNGVEVIECQVQLWSGIEDRVKAASGGWVNPRFWWRVILAYTQLVQRHCRVGTYDVMVVGYPGQLDVFLGRLLTWLRKRPLVWDVFMSIYLIAIERNLGLRSRLTLQLIRLIERLACRLPDRLILDTSEYVSWFGRTHGVPAGRFRLVPTGADNRLFKPRPAAKSEGGLFRVLYYGTFIPNHGVEYIVEAAHLLADESMIRFEMIGDGPDRPQVIELTQQYGLTNIEFVSWLDPAALVERIAASDVCLGAFGTTPQSLMTVQNKIYEGMAMARPVITGDSAAVRQAFVHGEQIYLCPRASGADLAAAIRRLHNDSNLRQRLGEGGYHVFSQGFTIDRIGERFAEYLRELTKRGCA